MSLRAEIHDAIDEVTPPAPDLEFRVTGLLVDHARGEKVVLRRGGRARWTKPLRGVVTLVAAALAVVLIGGLILSGRIWRDLHTQPQTINQAELKKLEAHPLLQLPVVGPGATCPTSPFADVHAHGPEAMVLGVGPVYSTPISSPWETTNWGAWTSLGLEVDTTKASGQLLIRARDLGTSERVVFVRYPFHAIDQAGDGIPAGRVLGSQVVQGVTERLYPELVIDTSRIYVVLGSNPGDWPIFKGDMGVPKAATGCVGLQIDGANFTELVVVST